MNETPFTEINRLGPRLDRLRAIYAAQYDSDKSVSPLLHAELVGLEARMRLLVKYADEALARVRKEAEQA